MQKKIKKIIILTQDYDPSSDGISTWCRALSNELIHQGFQVTVITKSYDGNPNQLNIPIKEKDQIPVIRLEHKKWKSGKYRRLMFAMRPYISEDTLFLCSNWKMGIPCRLLYFVMKVNYMVAVHGIDAIVNRKLQAIQQKSVLYHAKGVFAVSQYTKELLHHIDFQKINFTIIHNGVDTHKYNVQKPPSEIIKKYHIQPGYCILSLARLIRRKGFDMTLKALPLMKIQNIHYYIAGTGPYEPDLQKIVKELKLNEKVHFIGHIPEEDIHNIYNAMDVYCMPSRNHKGNVEGFGITYLEAGACGVPCIGGKHSGAEDAIVHDQTGLLVDPESSEDIAIALDVLLSCPEKRNEMGQKAIERIQNEFTWEKIVTDLIEFSQKCIS